MDITFIITALTFISALTVLTVQAIKKLMDEAGKTYNSTILAAVVSCPLSVATSVCYIIYNSVTVDAKVIITVLFLVFLSFLCATVGYDKVVKELFHKGE